MIESITRANITAAAAAVVCAMPIRTARYALALMPLLGCSAPLNKRRTLVSPIDTVRLSVIARLDDLGVSMPEAIDIVQTAVDPHLVGLAMCGIDTPPEFMLQRLDGLVLDLAPRPEGQDLYSGEESVPPIRAAVVLRINVGMIAAETIRRLEPRPAGVRCSAGRTLRGRGAPVSGPTILPTTNAGTSGQESHQ